MTDQEVVENLHALVDEYGEEFGFTQASTFREKGVFTKNLGLVVSDGDDEEHQLALLGSYDSE